VRSIEVSELFAKLLGKDFVMLVVDVKLDLYGASRHCIEYLSLAIKQPVVRSQSETFFRALGTIIEFCRISHAADAFLHVVR
jgi:hypothetical protein